MVIIGVVSVGYGAACYLRSKEFEMAEVLSRFGCQVVWIINYIYSWLSLQGAFLGSVGEEKNYKYSFW